MTTKYDVTVIGATGMVGEEFLRILANRQFPLGSLRLLASARSAGKKIEFAGREIVVEALSEDSLEGCDLAGSKRSDTGIAPKSVRAKGRGNRNRVRPRLYIDGEERSCKRVLRPSPLGRRAESRIVPEPSIEFSHRVFQ